MYIRVCWLGLASKCNTFWVSRHSKFLGWCLVEIFESVLYLCHTNTCNTPSVRSSLRSTISILYHRANLRSLSTLLPSKCNSSHRLNSNSNNSKVLKPGHLSLRYQWHMSNCFQLCCTKDTAQPRPASLRLTHYLLGFVLTSGAIFIKGLWATMWKDVTLWSTLWRSW